MGAEKESASTQVSQLILQDRLNPVDLDTSLG